MLFVHHRRDHRNKHVLCNFLMKGCCLLMVGLIPWAVSSSQADQLKDGIPIRQCLQFRHTVYLPPTVFSINTKQFEQDWISFHGYWHPAVLQWFRGDFAFKCESIPERKLIFPDCLMEEEECQIIWSQLSPCSAFGTANYVLLPYLEFILRM